MLAVLMLPAMAAKGCFDSCWQLADSVLGRSICLIRYGQVRADPLFPREKWVKGDDDNNIFYV